MPRNPKPRRDYGMIVLFVVLRIIAAAVIFAALDTEFWQSILLLVGLQLLIWTMIAEERRR